MHRTSKRPFFLMELLVALVLIGTLLTLLFHFFSSTLRMDQKVDAARRALYLRQHFQIRLNHILTSIVPRSSVPTSERSSFFTSDEKSGALRVVFDNGIDPDPAFSGAVSGKICLDEQSNLTLYIEPLETSASGPYRKELLLGGVQKLQWSFLAKSSSADRYEWKESWPKSRWDIPTQVRLIAMQGQSSLAFAFSLPFADPITYERQKS